MPLKIPCYSASNVRFNSANLQQQDQQHFRLNRAKTAFQKGSSVTRNGARFQKSKSISHEFADDFFIKGFNAFKADKNSTGLRRGKPKKATNNDVRTLTYKELTRLREAAKVVSVEEQIDAIRLNIAETKRLEEESKAVREKYRVEDEARKKATKVETDDEDLSGNSERLKILDRAFFAKHEQEQEVKRVNRIILDAKCHAVRDAQIQEKAELEKQLKDEERRLEYIVLERAKQSLTEEDVKYEKRKEVKQKYAEEIKKQLLEREKLRLREAEQIEDEAKQLRKAQEVIEADEQRQAQLLRDRRTKFRAELAKIAEMSEVFKKMLSDREREAEMRIAAYMRERQKRERALELERKLAKAELERKQQQLYLLSQKVTDSKSRQEEISYIREQERAEREYRRREKEAAKRKLEIEREVMEVRARQVQESKQKQALQIARDEEEFNKLVQRLQVEEEKQRKLDKQRETKRHAYHADIVRQMADKKLSMQRLEELDRNQTLAWQENERQRDANIRLVINAKLAAMRQACLPERYIKDVEKQLQKISVTTK